MMRTYRRIFLYLLNLEWKEQTPFYFNPLSGSLMTSLTIDPTPPILMPIGKPLNPPMLIKLAMIKNPLDPHHSEITMQSRGSLGMINPAMPRHLTCLFSHFTQWTPLSSHQTNPTLLAISCPSPIRFIPLSTRPTHPLPKSLQNHHSIDV